MNSSNSPSTKYLSQASQAVWYVVGIFDIFLLFRFLFKLLTANPEAGFTNFIYSVTEPFIRPFITVFGISKLEDNVFEWTTLLAMVVYTLLGWGISKILLMNTTVSTSETPKFRKQENS